MLAAFVCKELWTISPYMEYGSCDKIIKEGFPLGLPEAAILLILREVLKALDNIHRMGYVHRAVKAHHILIDGNGTVCLTGLRESHCLSPNGYNHVYDFPEDAVASVPWLAPEVLEQNILGYDYRSDIYSLGITAVEMACGIEPHKNVSATQVLLAKLQENDVNLQNLNDSRLSRTCGASDSGVGDSFGVTRQGRRESVENKKFSMLFSEFVDCCLQKEPKNRPSARMLLNHAFLKQAKKKIKRSLPELLLPVRPQTFENVAISNEEIKTANVCSVTESLDKLDVSSWNF
ncbi:STE20-related kinase adapter protein alpha-like [Xenia sp. Carnegie-2017]|uniref:STE20-related kinase adapter protein alpha-like n=1 Tax=Xenia sp. Carnegie-2017 TaxID=2897299 RepID=UPI001F048A39|nr:STE20-related kinase adapter protein alpha-like [Xenia sp. Carnegie-2017]